MTQTLEILDQDYEMVEVSAMRPHPFNPNRGDEDALAASVEESGFYGAVTLRDHPEEEGAYQILCGEHRWRLGARRNAEVLPAIVIRPCDDVKAVRIMLADNEVARRGSYEQDALDKALDFLGDIKGSGFDNVLEAAGAAADEADAAEEEATGAYSDDGSDDPEFAQEWGILVMADSELEQQTIFESLAGTYGASKLRVVSV